MSRPTLIQFVILPLALYSFVVFAVASQSEQYPGQSHHGEPPAGWVCSNHPNAPKDHKCGCNPTCSKDESGKVTIAEDPKCTVYCWKDKHCACEHQCAGT